MTTPLFSASWEKLGGRFFGGSAATATSTSSLFTGGSGPQDLIYFPDSADWNLAAGSFTIESFIYPISTVGSFKTLVSQQGLAGGFGWMLWLDSDQLMWVVSTTGSDLNFDMTSAAGIITTGAWFHVCVDYNGTKYRMYINGAMVASFTTPRTIFNSPNQLCVGGDFQQLLKFFNGYTDNLRITKGVARYATDTSFTVPTTPFPTTLAGDPSWASVVLLMPFEGTNGSTGAPGMTDQSSAAHGTATTNGTTVAISTAQHK